MLNLHLFLLIISINSYASSTTVPSSSYVNFLGENADFTKFPYQVSLRKSTSEEHFCSGAILNESFIITAAHCLYNKDGNELEKKEFFVIAGQSEIKLEASKRKTLKYLVKKIVKHPSFKFKEIYEHDLALVQLEKHLTVRHNRIKPIRLNDKEIGNNMICVVSGWASAAQTLKTRQRKNSNTLKKDDLIVAMSPTTCRSHRYPEELNKLITHGSFCTESTRNESRNPSETLCEVPEDPGGPLVCNGLLTGIVSARADCSIMGHPGVYTDIQQHLSWIGSQKVQRPTMRSAEEEEFERLEATERRNRGRSSSAKCFCNNYLFSFLFLLVIAIKFTY